MIQEPRVVFCREKNRPNFFDKLLHQTIPCSQIMIILTLQLISGVSREIAIRQEVILARVAYPQNPDTLVAVQQNQPAESINTIATPNRRRNIFGVHGGKFVKNYSRVLEYAHHQYR